MQPAVPRSVHTITYWVVLAGVAAVGLGWLLAHGPDAWRRPFLTPVAVGLLTGFLLRTLVHRQSVYDRQRGQRMVRWLAVALTVTTLVRMHMGLFQRIEQAAEANVRANPDQVQSLAFSEQLLEEDPRSAPQVRQLRLAVRPNVRDYLSHRSAALIGERPWPVPVIVLGAELLLAAAAAGIVAGWPVHSSGEPDDVSPRTASEAAG